MRLGSSQQAQVQRCEVSAAIEVECPACQRGRSTAPIIYRSHAAEQSAYFSADPLYALLDVGHPGLPDLHFSRRQQRSTVWQEDI